MIMREVMIVETPVRTLYDFSDPLVKVGSSETVAFG
jgi:hypothetical protein